MTARGNHGCRIVALALGIGMAAAAAQGGDNAMTAETAGGPVRCEIEITPLGSGVALRGMVFARTHVQGAYKLQVSKTGSGSSNINQAGKFDARPDAPAKLGTIKLGGDRGTYRATLKVKWNDQEIECEKTVGGGWL